MASVSKYISILKRNGLAVNNLYSIGIALPEGTLRTMLEADRDFDIIKQEDYSRQINNGTITSDVLSGGSSGYKSGGILGGIGGAAKGVYSGVSKQFTPQINSIKSLLGISSSSKGSTDSDKSAFDKIEITEMLCTSTQIPFYKHKVGTTFVNSMQKKFATGVDTDSLKMTFYVDRDNAVLSLFEQWHQLIHSVSMQAGIMKYKSEYGANININMLNKNLTGNYINVFSAVLVGAYPAFIEPIILNNNNTELIQLNVVFEFDKVFHVVYSPPEVGFDLSAKEFVTGFSILDMKNRVEQGINNVKDIAKTAQNVVKSGRVTVEDMKNTAKRAFKF